MALITRIAHAFTAEPADGGGMDRLRLLDIHSDADHNRSVFTLFGEANALSDGLLSGITEAAGQVDVMSDAARRGVHPHVGAVDVVPLVYFRPQDRGCACAQALVVAEEIGRRLDVPVFLYGELAGGRTRAELRKGGVEGLRRRMHAGEHTPDFGPARLHATAGATLVAAREPLVAFNLELKQPADVEDAQRIAALIREGGDEGIVGLRAIGVPLSRGVAQVSINIERPLETRLVDVVRAVAKHRPVARAELVGLTPRAALEGLPAELPMPGFDPARHVIENAIGL